MNPVVHGFLRDLRTGPAVRFRNMTVYPIFGTRESRLHYMTLEEALEKEVLDVKEVDAGGDVPRLIAVNRSDRPILVLDGQELLGNKQNRVLNTSILLHPHSETEIPVTCSERGRWSRAMPKVSYTKVFAAASMRHMNAKEVASSLKMGEGFTTNQLKFWLEVGKQQFASKTKSPSQAMADTYKKMKQNLESYLKAFPYQTGQSGIVVSLRGKIVGFDALSNPQAYRQIHDELVKSFAMDAALSEEAGAGEATADSVSDSVEQFLNEITQEDESTFDGVGDGREFHYEKEEAGGRALVCDDEVVHASFYGRPKEVPVGS